MESVEEHGRRKGMPVVACVSHDLLSALTGHPLVVSLVDKDGVSTEAVLRLMTAEEFQAANKEAVDSFGGHMPYCTHAEAVRVTEPLRIPGF